MEILLHSELHLLQDHHTYLVLQINLNFNNTSYFCKKFDFYLFMIEINKKKTFKELRFSLNLDDCEDGVTRQMTDVKLYLFIESCKQYNSFDLTIRSCIY